MPTVCADAACPYATISAALAAGETDLEVGDGTYTEATLRVSGPGTAVTITGLGAVSIAATPGPTPVFEVRDGASLTLVNVSASKLGARVIEVAEGASVTLRDSAFYAIGPADGGSVARVTDGSLVIDGCTLSASATSGDGGHLLVVDGALVVGNTLLRGGSARRGGAISLKAEAGPMAVVIAHSRFEGNLASGIGGAIETEGPVTLTVVDSTFEAGIAAEGGAIGVVTPADQITLENTRLARNRAARGSALSVSGPLTLVGAVVEANEGEEGSTLEADGDTTVERTVFCGNRTTRRGAPVARLAQGTHRWSHDRLWLNEGDDFGALVVDGALALEHSFLLANQGEEAAALRVNESGGVRSLGNVYAYSQGPFVALADSDSLFLSDLTFANGSGRIPAGTIFQAVEADPRFFGVGVGLSCDAIDDRYALRSPLVDALPGEDLDHDGTAADLGPYGGAGGADDPLWRDDDKDRVPALYDCDDTNAEFAPFRFGELSTEIPYDGIDQACDGGSDYDVDGDGYETSVEGRPVPAGLDDCDDGDPTVNPGGRDAFIDGESVDRNCDDQADADRDGVPAGPSQDCDDQDPTIRPGIVEDADLERDSNCDGVPEPEGQLVPSGCSVVGRQSVGHRALAASRAGAGAGPGSTGALVAALAAAVATRRRARGGSCRA